MRQILDVSYGKKPVQMLDWYLPDGEGFDLIIWFHGGGMRTGSRRGAVGTALAHSAVSHGYGFVSVEYGMYPEARYPDFINDSAEAVAFALAHMGEYGAKRAVVTGSSAGAYLTMMLAMNPAYLNNAGADRSKLAAYVSDSAQQTVHFEVLRERGVDRRAERIDEAAPLYYTFVHPLDKPMLLISYTQDMTCRLEQNQLMYRSLAEANPEMKIALRVLEGGHCAGSTRKDENGEFAYLLELIRFMKEIEK